MKVTSNGQVTIPTHIRSYLGVGAHSDVEFEIDNGKVVLHKAETASEGVGTSRFARLRGYRKGQMTTDEWMQATRAWRSGH